MSLLNFTNESQRVADWIQQVQALEAEADNAKNNAALQLLALRQNPMRNRTQTQKRSYTASDGSRVVIQNTDTIQYFRSLAGPSAPVAKARAPAKTVGLAKKAGPAKTVGATKRKSTQPRCYVKAVVPPKKPKLVGAAKRKVTQPYRYIEEVEESESETESESSESEDEEAEEILDDE